MSLKIGVLALQGAYELHRPHIAALGAEFRAVVSSEDFNGIDALILPGGESSTMLKLIETVGITEPLTRFLREKPAWGICAGAILMAKTVRNPSQKSFGVLDIEIERNAYGRQLESVEETIDGYQVSYIRAPRITQVGSGVAVLAKRDGTPSWIESGRLMATTFHPETNLNTPSPWHQRLLERCGLI